MDLKHAIPVRRNTSDERVDINRFASLAMHAIIQRNGVPETASTRDEVALWSFRMAEAMITARKQLGD